MVSKDRMVASEPTEPRAPGFLWPVLICLGTIFLAGILAGYNSALADAGKSSLDPLATSLIALALGAGALVLYFRRHADWLRGLSPRRRRYWSALGLSAIVGGVIGGWMQLDQAQSGGAIVFLGNGALSAGFAIGASIFWVIGLIVGLAIYHRSIDDHEQRAWLWAGLVGWYAFIFPAPVWWVLHRADLAPPIDAMLLFLVSMVANAIVYLWLKFR